MFKSYKYVSKYLLVLYHFFNILSMTGVDPNSIMTVVDPQHRDS